MIPVSTDPPNKKSKIRIRSKSKKTRSGKKSQAQRVEKGVIEIRPQLTKNTSSLKIFEEVTGLDELIKVVVTLSNLYTQQTGRMFEVDAKEMKTFLGINYIIAISKLLSITEYWRVYTFIGSFVVQSTMIRNCFTQIHKNFYTNMY